MSKFLNHGNLPSYKKQTPNIVDNNSTTNNPGNILEILFLKKTKTDSLLWTLWKIKKPLIIKKPFSPMEE